MSTSSPVQKEKSRGLNGTRSDIVSIGNGGIRRTSTVGLGDDHPSLRSCYLLGLQDLKKIVVRGSKLVT